jgi:nitrite reductase (NADH) large subunit
MKKRGKKEKLVIIGNGMAGVACLEEILKLSGEKFDITVFGAERHPNYNRVLLSHVLSGEKTLSDIALHDGKWYEEHGIELHTGSPVTELNRAARKVVTSEGASFSYDRLIFATGSLPFMPPIKGIDKEGVVPFRTIDDCERIRAAIAGTEDARCVVIGGGLLGLEAAHALLELNTNVSLVHIMDRLMERQLDGVAAAFLVNDIKSLGIKVLLNKETKEITGNGKVEGLEFTDNTSIEADLIVMSVGIKPNIMVARESGLYCEKGIIVSDTMQSYDPSVYAIGECIEHRGKTFGLVGPIFEQARVLANHLAGDSRLTFASLPTSTRLKVPGVDLYSAGIVDETEETEAIEYIDKASRVYRKLLVRESRVLGIVMYGDTEDGPRLFESLVNGEDITDKRQSILFGETSSKGMNVEAMSDEAIVCGCNGISKGAIKDAIKSKGLFSREEVCSETKAGSSCGGCGTIIDKLLESVLGSNFDGTRQSTGICKCTNYSRDDIIKNIRERELKSVTEVMDTLGWETVGCDECRPAINYYVSMVWPLKARDDQSSRLINERAHANIQEDGTFSVVPRIYGGVVTPKELMRIADAAERYDVPLVKLTGGQRIDLIGVKKEDLSQVWKDIAMPSGYAYAKALRTAKSCVGERFCRYGTQDSLGLAIELEKLLEGLWMPAKVKLGVSGCPRNCAESAIKDIGIVGISGGFEVYVGGSGGIELKSGKLLCTVKDNKEVIESVLAFIQYYREDAIYGERSFKWLRRRGLEEIKRQLIEDTLNADGLRKRIGAALSVVEEPWGALTEA